MLYTLSGWCWGVVHTEWMVLGYCTLSGLCWAVVGGVVHLVGCVGVLYILRGWCWGVVHTQCIQYVKPFIKMVMQHEINIDFT